MIFKGYLKTVEKYKDDLLTYVLYQHTVTNMMMMMTNMIMVSNRIEIPQKLISTIDGADCWVFGYNCAMIHPSENNYCDTFFFTF